MQNPCSCLCRCSVRFSRSIVCLHLQANATLKAKVDILRSNLADVRSQAERSEQLEAELAAVSTKLQQAETALAAAGGAAGAVADGGAGSAANAGGDGASQSEDVPALKQRLAEAEAQLAAAAEEAEEARQWQADETAELQAKLTKAEARLAAAASDAEVCSTDVEPNCGIFACWPDAYLFNVGLTDIAPHCHTAENMLTSGEHRRRKRRRMQLQPSCTSGWPQPRASWRPCLMRHRRSTSVGRRLCSNAWPRLRRSWHLPLTRHRSF